MEGSSGSKRYGNRNREGGIDERIEYVGVECVEGYDVGQFDSAVISIARGCIGDVSIEYKCIAGYGEWCAWCGETV